MNFILDTNILFSALIKDSTSREILFSPKFKFYLPEYSLTELKKYYTEISKKSNLKESEINDLLKRILKKSVIVPFNKYKQKLEKAMKIIGSIDEKDSPFISTALCIKNEGIWTNDKHFLKQNEIKIFSTLDMINLLKSFI